MEGASKTIMKTLFNKTISCGQNNIKDLGITQNGTVTVHTSEEVELPHAKIANATVEMGHGEIRAFKEIRKNYYCGPRSKVLHKSEVSSGKTSVVLDKGRIVAVHIHAECGDVEDLLAAIYEAINKIADDETLTGRNFKSEADLMARSYSRDKKAYDRNETKRVEALMKQEETDKARIREAFKAPSTSPFGGVQ